MPEQPLKVSRTAQTGAGHVPKNYGNKAEPIQESFEDVTVPAGWHTAPLLQQESLVLSMFGPATGNTAGGTNVNTASRKFLRWVR